MNAIASRLSEPSTWAGLSILASLFGIPPVYLPLIPKVGAGVAAVAAVLIPEKASK